MSKANVKQVGGKHYKKFKYQPWDVVTDWELGYLDGTALKYLSRWRDKNGLEDIQKAIHFLEKLIEVEGEKSGNDVPATSGRDYQEIRAIAQRISEPGTQDPASDCRQLIRGDGPHGGGWGSFGPLCEGPAKTSAGRQDGPDERTR